MPCEICGAHPTWYDLSECTRKDCPWETNPGRPIPPLPKELWNPPPVARVTGPKPAKPMGGPKPPLPATMSGNAAQPHSWESKVDKIMEGMSGPKPAMPNAVTPDPATSPATPPKMNWSQIAQKPQPQVAKPPVPPVQPKPAVQSTAKPARTLSKTLEADYDEIMRYVDNMRWEGSHGPSCRIQTKIEWKNKDCRELYLYIKDELHDQKFTYNNKTLYYYVGAIGNWGKAGFRITGHSKPSSQVKNSTTFGVLHVEN